MGGWQAFKEARALHAAGRVLEASYEPPWLKGRLTEGGKSFLAGLKLRNAIDVENLCSCRDSRVRGIICAHSLAIGLQVIKPVTSGQMAASRNPTTRPAPSRRHTDEEPRVELTLEGSLRHLEAEIHFRYNQPDVANGARETGRSRNCYAWIRRGQWQSGAPRRGRLSCALFGGLPGLRQSGR